MTDPWYPEMVQEATPEDEPGPDEELAADEEAGEDEPQAVLQLDDVRSGIIPDDVIQGEGET